MLEYQRRHVDTSGSRLYDGAYEENNRARPDRRLLSILLQFVLLDELSFFGAAPIKTARFDPFRFPAAAAALNNCPMPKHRRH